ncbi:MAG TPA: hypothetical protein VNI01_07980 [Elusimicrobiota bacterium]|jgi:hypothetical protein|nr:hypothetical protein [Elusimicrobiota bacterium]
MPNAFPSLMNMLFNPIQDLTTQTILIIPSILVALILLLMGSFIGRGLRGALERILTVGKLDNYSQKIGISHVLFKLGLGQSPTAILGFLLYWLVFLAFLLSAANVVQLTVVSEFLQQVVLFMPKVIASVLVLGGGLFLSHFAGEVVFSAAKANKIGEAELLSRFAYGIIVVFSSIIALQRLGIDTTILSQSLQIIIAAMGFGLSLAFGLAFGLAGKDAAHAWLAKRLREK